MASEVKGRRQAQAAATRDEILGAARRLFLADGYAATTIDAVAAEAGVAVQTIYNSVGGKAALLATVLGVAAAGDSGPASVVERESRRGAAITDPRVFVAQAASSVAARLARVGPVLVVVEAAAHTGDAAAAGLARQVAAQRMAGLQVMVRELRALGGMRAGLGEEAAAALVWSLGSPDTWRRLVMEQGWSQARYRRWLADAFAAALLERPPAAP